MTLDVRLLDRAFNPGDELAAFTAAQAEAGGIASFLGQVRNGGGVEALELRHYAPLTLSGMKQLAEQAMHRWPLHGLLIIHRTGMMLPGAPIVLVAAAARHRRDAFAVAEFAMDHLKSESWFWKREKVAGAWSWVEPRDVDFEDVRRWA
jgi:molybdopterin synthase catalytic subunit